MTTAHNGGTHRRRPAVWIFNHYAGYPETVPATRTFELARELIGHGWDVTVIACSFNHYTFTDDLDADDPVVTERARDGVNWVFIKSAPYVSNGLARLRNMLLYAKRAMAWASAQEVSPDIAIGTTVHPFAAEAARRIARRTGARFVYEVTDLWPESLVDLGSLKRGSALFRVMFALERRAMATADGIIGLMPGLPDYVRERHGWEVGSFAYVPNGMRLSQTDPGGDPPTRGTVAYAGGFARAHGMATVIDAAAHLQEAQTSSVTLHLYGDGLERPALERRAGELGLKNVVFHGMVPKSEVRRHIREAEICLCTSNSLPVHRFGISFNKLFDYFEASRPVIFAVDSGNNPVSDVGAGLSIPAGDSERLAAAIAELATRSPEVLNDMGASGRAFLEREHDFRVLGARLHGYLWDTANCRA